MTSSYFVAFVLILLRQSLLPEFKAIVGYIQDCSHCSAIADILALLLNLVVKNGKQYVGYLESVCYCILLLSNADT